MKNDDRKAPRLRLLAGGKRSRVRSPHEACGDWPIELRTPGDEVYAAEVLRLVADHERARTRLRLNLVSAEPER